MPRATEPLPLTKAVARRIWLRAQRLDTPVPFGAGPQAAAAAIEHLGYVQIDTINVIERCHHHILYSRIPAYSRADLRAAQSADKSVFEYWTHALSYVPTKDFRFFVPLMKLHKREGHRWFASVKPEDTRKVMRLLRRDGALTIRDIEDDVLTEKEHLWHSRKPSKRALQLAFYTGEVTVSERTGMLKTYELDAPSKANVHRLIEARVRRKELTAVALEGAGKQQHWAKPEVIESEVLEPGAAASAGEGDAGLVHILSPFDPLIIQRKRTELFFGYGHRFEAYVPKEKRVLGYFALPVLVGNDIVAALDLKTDRQNRKLLMQKWNWVGKGAARGGARLYKRRIEQELDRFERFQLAE